MAIETNDLVAGLDPTGYISITGSELLEMVNGAVAAASKGFIIKTTDIAGNPEVPDAATTTSWQRYLWLRVTATTAKLYAWNPNAANDATYLKWLDVTAIALSAGIITNAMLQGGITYDKISSVQWSSIVGSPTFLSTISEPAAGDISGSFGAGFTIGNDKVTTAKILNANVTPAKLEGTMGYQLIQTQYALEAGLVTIDAAGTASYIIPNDDTIPQNTEGYNVSTLNTTIVPKRTTSLLVVEFETFMTGVATPANLIAAIFRDATAGAVAAGLITIPTTQYLQHFKLQYIVAAGSLSSTTFKVNVGPSTAIVAYMNGNAATRKLGGVMRSSLKVSELYL